MACKKNDTDFAGSSVVHSGGWASLVAAALVGPRIGKYNTEGRKCNTWTQFNVRCLRGVYFMVWMVWL
jgi:Amt family ammonium transporter